MRQRTLDDIHDPLDVIWTTHTAKGHDTFTKIPNLLLRALVFGVFSKNEGQIILYLARLTFGFNNDETKYLSIPEIARETGIESNHVAGILKKLMCDQAIFKGKKSPAGFHKYAINVLPFGLKMAHYRLVEHPDEIGVDEEIICQHDYKICTSMVEGGYLIAYKPKASNRKKK